MPTLKLSSVDKKPDPLKWGGGESRKRGSLKNNLNLSMPAAEKLIDWLEPKKRAKGG